MAKAQIISQTFVMIIAGIVFVMLMAFGYKVISELNQKADIAGMQEVTSELSSQVLALKNSYGDHIVMKLKGIPDKYHLMCIITAKDSGTLDNTLTEIGSYNQRIASKYIPEGRQNVFFDPAEPTPIFIENINAQGLPGINGGNGWFCTKPSGGVVTLVLDARGNKGVTVSLGD